MFAYPNAVGARELVFELSSTLKQDWAAVVRFAETKGYIAADTSQPLAAAFQLATHHQTRLPSDYFHFYFRALGAIREGRPDEVTEAMRGLGEVVASGRETEPVGPLAVRRSTPAIAYALRSYEARTTELSGLPTSLRLIDPESRIGARIIDRAAAARDLIRMGCPPLADEIQAVTEYLVLLEGNDFVGGSDIAVFGASFLRLEPEWSPLCFADHIVHEEAHQLLHAAQEVNRLLLNRDKMGQASPIRRDPRPLYGSFHATFVFLRLASFMSSVTLSPALGEWRDEAHLRLHRHLLGLLQGLRIVQDNGEFSPLGRQVVDEWIDAAHQLLDRHGPPDRALVPTLNWDYEPANVDLPVLVL